MPIKHIIQLTRDLIRFNTVNPPGDEKYLAKYIGNLLSDNGFDVNYVPFDANRLHVIAEKGLCQDIAPIVFSGHLDTVPLGANEWSVEPFSGEVVGDKIFGRGVSDMKGGVAAVICAAIHTFDEGEPKGGVRLIFTANEELGCKGLLQLIECYKNLGSARGIIVAEPTANIPAIGHKGGLYMNLSTSGITAHSSMPELGDNAIYKAAKAILKVANFKFKVEKDSLLGFPTINVGKMSGGLNLNSVPDHAEFTVDIRSTTNVSHSSIIRNLKDMLGDEVMLKILVDLPPLSTVEDESFVQFVYDVCRIDRVKGGFPLALPYLTEGSVLQNFYNGAPTIILGPGQPEMAHKTDEFCYINKLEEALMIYKEIILG